MDSLINVLDWLQLHPQLAAAVFVLLVSVVMAVGIPGGNLLLLTSGLLFGAWAGALLATAGLLLGAWFTHALVFHTFGRWLQQRAGEEQKRWQGLAAEHNAPLLILPRLVLVIPFFLINIAYASARVPLATYLWTTLAGVFPVALLLARIGSRFSDMNALGEVSVVTLLLNMEVWLPLVGLLVLTAIGWLLLRRHQAT